jgi:hypothetical protein
MQPVLLLWNLPRLRIYSSDVPSCIMTTPTPSPGHTISLWKRLAIIGLFGGVGFAVALSTIIGAVVWNNSRRKPSEPWNTNAIVADDSPRFDPSADAKKVVFRYSLNNTTDIDYHIDSNDTYKLMVKTKDDIFTAPMARETASRNSARLHTCQTKIFLQSVPRHEPSTAKCRRIRRRIS